MSLNRFLTILCYISDKVPWIFSASCSTNTENPRPHSDLLPGITPSLWEGRREESIRCLEGGFKFNSWLIYLWFCFSKTTKNLLREEYTN